MIKYVWLAFIFLTHWGRMTHICVDNLTTNASDNGFSPDRRQAIIWTSAGILFIRPLGTNFSDTWIETHIFSLKNAFENVVWKMSAILFRPQCVNQDFSAFWWKPGVMQTDRDICRGWPASGKINSLHGYSFQATSVNDRNVRGYIRSELRKIWIGLWNDEDNKCSGFDGNPRT